MQVTTKLQYVRKIDNQNSEFPGTCMNHLNMRSVEHCRIAGIRLECTCFTVSAERRVYARLGFIPKFDMSMVLHFDCLDSHSAKGQQVHSQSEECEKVDSETGLKRQFLLVPRL